MTPPTYVQPTVAGAYAVARCRLAACDARLATYGLLPRLIEFDREVRSQLWQHLHLDKQVAMLNVLMFGGLCGPEAHAEALSLVTVARIGTDTGLGYTLSENFLDSGIGTISSRQDEAQLRADIESCRQFICD